MAPYCFRTHVTIDRNMIFRKPGHMSFEEAATLPTVYLTAYYALNHLGHLQKGETILIHAGSGGVGQAAIRIAKGNRSGDIYHRRHSGKARVPPGYGRLPCDGFP